ncbi:ABC transporter permease [Yonghaparkia sp. Soil809]|uniref:ABC transporter permease n=1 Tax=Yonghaparkia sp. Soil809 TaxID=1736417 RepID=UPI0006F94C4C|nr:ABC transporter permease [Yonghaparkia sp. Soil809]KRF33903.1 sodium ABC transporter permease [Yonghaparkia sp. Soil809]
MSFSSSTASGARRPGDALAAPSLRASVALIAGREITSRVRSKWFLISTVILLLFVVAGIVGSHLFSSSLGDTRVAAVGAAADLLEDAPGLEIESSTSAEAAERLVRDGDVEAAVVPLQDAEPGAPAFEVIALSDAPGALVQALSIAPDVRLLDPSPVDQGIGFIVAFAFGIIFFTAAITFGGTVAQSVVEEKQTRIVEILLTAVPAKALLAGKVIGSSVLALGQILLIAVAAGLSLMLTGQDVLLADLGPAAVWFLGFFAIGFVLLAAMFAASAALVSRLEDVGTVIQPVTWLVMLPYFLIIFFNDNEAVLTVMSYVPFSSPVGMPVRIFLEQAQWWEPLVALVLLAGTAVVIVQLGARMYRNSLLRTGARVRLAEALRG